MKHGIKYYLKRLMLTICLLALSVVVALPSIAAPYHLIAGSTALGFRENDKQNVNLGFNAVFNEMLSSDNIQCDFKSFDSADELASAIKTNQVNAFFGSPLEFIRSEAYFLDKPIISGVFDGQISSKVIILVRKDSGIDSLLQLKGKSLARQKWISGDLGGLYLETLLLENKLPPPERFFAATQNTDTSNRAIIDVFFKKADAALVNESLFNIATELNPQLRAQTKIIIASEPYLTFVSALTNNTPEKDIKGIKKNMLSVHKTVKGRRIMNLMRFDSFEEISLAELDNVRALIAKNQKLKALQNGR